METEVSIRPGTAADVAAVFLLQEASPGAAGWSQKDYETFLGESGHVFLVAEGGGVVGFLAGQLGGDELEILNVAVEPAQQGRSVGAGLLREALRVAEERGAGSAWLEVRESNKRARQFYHSFGFQEAYRRPRFYRDPEEDAVVYRRALMSRGAA